MNQADDTAPRPTLATIAGEWGRIGCIGFGGPPTHIALLRKLCVQERRWLTETEFENGIAATNLLPGPASTQLAIIAPGGCAAPLGAIVGGMCFIVPGLIVILALAALFLAAHPPCWVMGAAAGAGAAVPAVAAHPAAGLVPASWRRAGASRAARVRWACYLIAGGIVATLSEPWLVLVLAGCGVSETAVHATQRSHPQAPAGRRRCDAAGACPAHSRSRRAGGGGVGGG